MPKTTLYFDPHQKCRSLIKEIRRNLKESVITWGVC